MLGNIVRRTLPILRHERILFRRYSLSQARLNVRNKEDTVVSSKDQRTIKTDHDDDDDTDEPLKYSISKAATMRTSEYRIPDSDKPWYQGPIISLSLTVFLIYFCILREENDIDLMLDKDLGDHLTDFEKRLAEKNASK